MSESNLKNDDFAQGMAHFCNGMGAFIVTVLFMFAFDVPHTRDAFLIALALCLLIISPHIALFFLIRHYAHAAFKNLLALIIAIIVTFLSIWLYTDAVFVRPSEESLTIFVVLPVYALAGTLSFMFVAEMVEFMINRAFTRKK